MGTESTATSESWAGSIARRYLPEDRRERNAWIGLFVLVMVLKVMMILHYRADSDETQHAHVVWAWTRGELPYRDVFDNHMPLFHMACALFFWMLGEHSFILVELRLAVLPLFFVCLWCVFKLAERLFSKRIAPWACLAAAALPGFLYTSTEFRPDILWAAVWLLSLVVALCGTFTLKRTFGLGILLGVVLAVSIKTPALWTALAVSSAIGFGLNAWLGKEKMRWRHVPLHLAAIGLGAVLVPGAIVLFFASKGALWIMYYCVLRHNMLPGLKRWGHFSFNRWVFPASIPALIGLGALTYRQAPDDATAVRRVILLVTPCCFGALLLSYSPEVTRQDALPYFPLLPLVAVPFITWLRTRIKAPRLEARFFTWIVPAVCLAELLWAWHLNPLRTNRMRITAHSIADVLLLTRPNDYVMDAEGDYIFRPRPCYWVFETVTKARIRLGDIKDDLTGRLEKTGALMCYFYAARVVPGATRFIVSNYIPFDRDALDLGVAGMELGETSGDETYPFDVAIPATYAVVSESGVTTGALDGAPYAGPVWIAAGHHVFHRTSGAGRVAIFLDRAQENGFRPLFDASEKIIETERHRDK